MVIGLLVPTIGFRCGSYISRSCSFSHVFILLFYYQHSTFYLICMCLGLLVEGWYYPYCSYVIDWYSGYGIHSIGVYFGIVVVSCVSVCCMLLYVVMMLMLCLVSYNYWIRDSIREYTSTYVTVMILICVSLIWFIASEILFFITMFWWWFQAFCSYVHSLEGVYISDPSSHVYINLIILSNSGISLGSTLVIRDIFRLHLIIVLYVWIIALTFLNIQIKEFHNLVLYMNESIYVSVFFSLLGLHLFHVVVGILIIGLILWTSCYSRSVLNFILLQLRVTPHLLLLVYQLVYWHFVDVLWLFIYFILYN